MSIAALQLDIEPVLGQGTQAGPAVYSDDEAQGAHDRDVDAARDLRGDYEASDGGRGEGFGSRLDHQPPRPHQPRRQDAEARQVQLYDPQGGVSDRLFALRVGGGSLKFGGCSLKLYSAVSCVYPDVSYCILNVFRHKQRDTPGYVGMRRDTIEVKCILDTLGYVKNMYF